MAVDPLSLVTLANLKTYLGITVSTDDTILEQAIDRASKIVEGYCGRKFVEQTYREFYDSFGAHRLTLKQRPISKVLFVGAATQSVLSVQLTDATAIFGSVSIDDDHLHVTKVSSTGSETTTTISFASHDTTTELASQISAISGFSAQALVAIPSFHLQRIAGAELMNRTVLVEGFVEGIYDYLGNLDAGILYGSWLSQYQSVLVRYTAGYSTIPFDVQEATMMIASRIYNGRKRDPGLSSESLGGYSYSARGSIDIDAEAKEILRPYRGLR